MRRKLAHVANAFGQSHGCGPAPKQALKPLGGLTARVVRVEGEEDAGAAPQGGCGLLNALGAQGGAGGKAPPGNRKPVEDALGEHRPRRSEAEPPKPKHRLGTGERLEPWGSVGVYGPPRKPPHKSPGYLWNDDHPREPLRAPLREQAGVPEPLGGEAGGLDGFAQPAPRREAEAQPQGGVHADAPGGKVPPRRRSAPKPPGVEPRRRRQQSRVPRRKNGGGRASLDGSTPPRGRRRSGGVNAAVQPPDRIGQAQALDALDEVQHVAAVTAAEAVELFGVAVHREAALGLIVEGADALADPAPSPEPHPRSLHRVSQGVAGLQRNQVHSPVGYDHDAPPLRGFRPRIGEQADYMRDLIGDLLDVARIETGELSVAPAPADVATLVDEARSRFQSGGGRNNLRIDLPPDLPLVMADGRRIIQVLNNLLTNAAGHSHEASAIGVSAVREGYHVAVSVTDEGRGIAAERLPHLFRKFSRIDGEDRRRDIAGSGLGLAICKGIVETHGGRIWAESDGPGLGARFTFTIPVAQGAAIGAAHLPVRSRRTERERTRILAVDDDPQTLRYVRDALTNAGYAPIVTGDPQEATSLVRANDPGLVLLDLMLPGTDGMELMKEIREVSDVPVIFLSVNGQEEIIARAFEMGADDYVVKPFSPTELVARIKAALRKREAPEWAEPSEPYVFGELTIDYAERRVTLAGRPVQLTAIEYGLLFELSANAGRVMTYDRLLQRVWGLRGSGDSRRVRTRRQAAPPQAGRRRQQPHLHPQRAPRRLPHGEGGGEGKGAIIAPYEYASR